MVLERADSSVEFFVTEGGVPAPGFKACAKQSQQTAAACDATDVNGRAIVGVLADLPISWQVTDGKKTKTGAHPGIPSNTVLTVTIDVDEPEPGEDSLLVPAIGVGLLGAAIVAALIASMRKV